MSAQPLKFLLLGSMSVIAFSACSGSGSGKPVDTSLKITPNFTSARTGWIKPDGEAIQFSINKGLLSTFEADELRCRSGLKKLINAQTWSDCTNGVHQPAPTAGSTNLLPNDNGTYTLEVEALKESAVVKSASYDFYVHPSLDRVPECVSSISDSQYFAEAANYLSMTDKFGAQTSLKGPKYRVEFSRTSSGNSPNNLRSVVSLRKRFKMNGDQSLILIRRDRAKLGAGGFDNVLDQGTLRQMTSGDVAQANTRSSYSTLDSACELSVSLARQTTKINVWSLVSDGMGGFLADHYRQKSWYYWDREVYSTSDSGPMFDPTIYSDVMAWSTTQGLKIGSVIHDTMGASELATFWDSQVSSNLRSDRPDLYKRALSCDAVVFNAQGKGLCFFKGHLNDPITLKSAARLFAPDEVYGSAANYYKTGNRRLISRLKIYPDAAWETFLQDPDFLNYSDDDIDGLLNRKMVVND